MDRPSPHKPSILDGFCQICHHHTSASEVERNHIMAVRGLPWISAKPHSESVINNTIKLNPACKRGKEWGKRRRKSGRQQYWNRMINVAGASAVCGKCRSWSESCALPASICLPGLSESGSRFQVCLCQICRSFSFDHIRGVTHWWSLIPQLEKGCPTKRSDVIYLRPLPHPHLLKKYNISFIYDEVGVNPLMGK